MTPQAVLFDANGTKVYSGRIDDQYVDFGSKRPRPTSEDLTDAIDAFVSGKPLVFQQTDAVGCYIADLLPAEHAIAP